MDGISYTFDRWPLLGGPDRALDRMLLKSRENGIKPNCYYYKVGLRVGYSEKSIRCHFMEVYYSLNYPYNRIIKESNIGS